MQECLPKIEELAGRELTWHFIGRLQANKTRPVAENFAWVHTIDRLKIAERLSSQRPFHAPALNVCLQLHVGGEASKGGVESAGIRELARQVSTLPRLRLRGLMCMPPAENDVTRQRQWFRETRQIFDYLNEHGLGLDTLSMGTSADYEAAIAEGATMVRIGTAIFGPRDTSHHWIEDTHANEHHCSIHRRRKHGRRPDSRAHRARPGAAEHQCRRSHTGATYRPCR